MTAKRKEPGHPRARGTSAKRSSTKPLGPIVFEDADPFFATWLALSPAERMRRSWRMRSRLINPEAIHDEKTFPEL